MEQTINSLIDISNLSAADRAEFDRLTRCRTAAWPTIILWVLVLGIYIGADALAIAGAIPLWVGMLVNCAVGYYAFSLAHDAIHRAIHPDMRINDWLGQAAVFLFAPYVHLPVFRWLHIQHHRFANSERDPDWNLHGGRWWTLPLRWMWIDVMYLGHTLRKIREGDKLAAKHWRNTLPWIAGSGLLAVLVIALGYGMALLMLWFIPSRVIFITLGYSFFWLPHVPHDTPQEENFTRATTVRIGHEWLMRPLLQWQHYHLIHHLYPMTPFYNNEKVWRLLEPQIRQHDLAVQHGFAVESTLYPAARAES
ncbi:MAG: fatty acid desaturase [Salinisphaera sp.]|nr:fatty acid desaturase [Salinisphaera sp.]